MLLSLVFIFPLLLLVGQSEAQLRQSLADESVLDNDGVSTILGILIVLALGVGAIFCCKWHCAAIGDDTPPTIDYPHGGAWMTQQRMRATTHASAAATGAGGRR